MDHILSLLSLVLFVAIILLIVSRLRKSTDDLEIELLNDKWNSWSWALKSLKLPKKAFKRQWKLAQKELKSKSLLDEQKTLFVLNFKGDLTASGVEGLRNEVTAILHSATAQTDEVLIQVTSAGGSVQDYGLAASQIKRLRDQNIRVTVSVDTIAASGGYLMACVAESIIASPFAIVGSIGVVAQFPNFHRLLKKWDVDYKEYTAGEFKRTVSLLGEIQPKGEQKFLDQLEQTHQFFKNYVQQYRPKVDIESLATGEYWYGQKAHELGLVDQVMTSDEYLMSYFSKGYQIVSIKLKTKKSWSHRISEGALTAVEHKVLSWLSRKV